MALTDPPEPSMDELRERADWSEGAWAAIEEDLRPERIAERQVPSYLCQNWEAILQQAGYDWQQFQSEIGGAMPVIHRWASGEAAWDEVLDRMKSSLEFREE